MSAPRVNDDERENWVLNDEGLYLWWISRDPDEKHLRRFVKAHRSEIDAVIRANQ